MAGMSRHYPRIPRRPVEMPWTAADEAEDEAVMARLDAAREREPDNEDAAGDEAIFNDPDAYAADDAWIDAQIARALRRRPR